MLKLDFKIGSRLLIGDNIWIEILKITDGLVGIGITAPHEVAVNREKIAIEKGIVTAAQASGVPRFRANPDHGKTVSGSVSEPVSENGHCSAPTRDSSTHLPAHRLTHSRPPSHD